MKSPRRLYETQEGTIVEEGDVRGELLVVGEDGETHDPRVVAYLAGCPSFTPPVLTGPGFVERFGVAFIRMTILDSLVAHGFDTAAKIDAATDNELMAAGGMDETAVSALRHNIKVHGDRIKVAVEIAEGEGSEGGPLKIKFVAKAVLGALEAAGFGTLALIAAATDEQLLAVAGVDPKVLAVLRKAAS